MKFANMKLIPAVAVSLLGSGAPSPAPAQTAQSASANKLVFACDRVALSGEARKRHFEILTPALRSAHKQIRELPNGFEFELPSDPSTTQTAFEWTTGERLCCPFFDIDLRFEHANGSLWLRLTGTEGVKPFIRSEFAAWFKQ